MPYKIKIQVAWQAAGEKGEQKANAKKNHFYLIEQVQANGDFYFQKSNKNPIISAGPDQSNNL